MQFKLETVKTIASASKKKVDLLLVLLSSLASEETGKSEAGSVAAQIQQAIASKDLAKAGDSIEIYNSPSKGAKRVLAVYAGDADTALDKVSAIATQLPQRKIKTAGIWLDASIANDQCLQKLMRTLNDASYVYQTSKPTAKSNPLKSVTLYCAKARGLQSAFKHQQATLEGVNLAKEWANRPANFATPTMLANTAKKLAKNHSNISCKVLLPKDIEKLKMGAFMSVAKGSDQPLRFIELQYKGGKAKDAPTVLVGKGITFDSGGISLKPGSGMDEMKYDMCGAASVLGAFRALAQLQPKINVVGLIPTCENMPSGGATKPGDVVTAMDGTTIEVLNTDAEGRLILCDTLCYAKRFKPRAVVDMATLTGACIIALGRVHSGMFSNDDGIAAALKAAGEEAADTCWQLPLDAAYRKQLNSKYADLANIGGREAGTVTAAKFLEHFTDYPWAHLDIAGTAWHTGARKGATGRPIPLLMRYLSNAAKS